MKTNKSPGLYAIPLWCRLANLEVQGAVLQELHWQNTQEVETAEFQYYCHGFIFLFLSERPKKKKKGFGGRGSQGKCEPPLSAVRGWVGGGLRDRKACRLHRTIFSRGLVCRFW